MMREIEKKHGEPIDLLLRRLYVAENLTMRQVAEQLGVGSDSTVWLWLLKFDIPARRWMLPRERSV
jgi:hypothetical protein